MPPMETGRHGISLEAGRAICQDNSMKTRRHGSCGKWLHFVALPRMGQDKPDTIVDK